MDFFFFSVVFLLGPIIGSAILYFVARRLNRPFAHEWDVFFAELGGMMGFTVSIFVLCYEWPLLKWLVIPGAAMFAWAAFVALLLLGPAAGLDLLACQRKQTLPIMRVVATKKIRK